MAEIITSVVAVVVVLGIMILVHEWGHFIAAKWCGVRVDIFSVGFGPRLWGRKRGDTDYRVSALPLGGYVKFAGDNPLEERAGAPDELLSKPRWQRALIVLAGPAMNILMTVVLLAALFYAVGQGVPAYLERPPDVAGVRRNSAAAGAGVQPGDRIARINETETPTWEQARTLVHQANPGSELRVLVERGEESVAFSVGVANPQDADDVLGYALMPAVVEHVAAGMPAERAGLRSGDQILGLNDLPIRTWPQVSEGIRGSDGQLLRVLVQRGARKIQLEVRPVQVQTSRGETLWQIGMINRLDVVYRRLGLVDSLGNAAAATLGHAREIVGVVGQLFIGKVSIGQLQGVVGIARESGQAVKRGALDFVNLMAVISLNLGILNLLPIPILDGGHLLLLSVEGTLRRDLSLAIKERFVQVGMVFLLVIFAIVMYNDVLRLLPNR